MPQRRMPKEETKDEVQESAMAYSERVTLVGSRATVLDDVPSKDRMGERKEAERSAYPRFRVMYAESLGTARIIAGPLATEKEEREEHI